MAFYCAPHRLRSTKHAVKALLLLCLMLVVVGCAGATPSSVHAPSASAAPDPESCDPARDHAAIVAMAGTFDVTFQFEETQALTPGYKLAEPERAQATEVVSVLEETDRRIVLQHVLLLQKYSGAWEAQKHWRQDWTFEDSQLLEFRGQHTWQRRTLTEDDVRCTWSQAVFEVDDAPRYESYGRFAHSAGPKAQSIWTSHTTWRPLPRREYTQRDDYDVLVAVNRHIVTEQGWRHEQDNVKLVLDGQRPLVRERGLNVYKRIDSPHSAAALQYMARTQAFWAAVRAQWRAALDRPDTLNIQPKYNGRPRYERLFALSDATASLPADEQRAQIHAAITDFVQLKSP